MKVWILSLCGLLIFFVLAFFVQSHLEKTAKKFDQKIDSIQKVLTERKWPQTVSGLNIVKKKWEKTKPLWAMLIHHREIDSIDEALIRTLKASKNKNYFDSQLELSTLRHFLQHIPERERLNLVNIL